MAALPTGDHAMEKSFARTRHAPSPVAIVLRVILLEHSLNAFVGLPTDIGRVFILHADFPLLLWQQLLLGLMRSRAASDGAGASIGKGSGIGGMFQDRDNRRDRRLSPHDVAKAIAPWHLQVVSVEGAQNLTGGTDL